MFATPKRSSSALIKAAQTPILRECRIEADDENQKDDENFTVYFPEDELRLTTIGLLGTGGFGKVYIAKTPSNEKFALKVSSKDLREQDFRRLREEVAIMSMLKGHKNVVQFETAAVNNHRAYVAMERCAQLSLSDLVTRRQLTLDEILWIGYQLVETVAFIHDRGCIHRDLKPQNLLFDFEGNLKVTDFGLSSRMKAAGPRKTVAGTAVFMAPEIAMNYLAQTDPTKKKNTIDYGTEVDAWSVGIVLYVLATRTTPYYMALANLKEKKEKQEAVFKAVAAGSWNWPEMCDIDPEYKALVTQILQERSSRPSVEEVLKDPLWRRRPYSCPISLLSSLRLIDEKGRNTPGGRTSLAARSTTNAIPKPTLQEVTTKAINALVAAEGRVRLEYVTEVNTMMALVCQSEEVFRQQIFRRASIEFEANAGVEKLRNQRRMSQPKARAGSLQLAETPGEMVSKPRPSFRRSVSISGGVGDGQQIVRSSPDRLAVHYPGRESATRWQLRSVVSLPREVSEEEVVTYSCMNNHIMQRLTRIPHGYDGYDCNVCEAQINRLTKTCFMYRCHKCDFDICMGCAHSHKEAETVYICSLCSKKFPTHQKMHKHTLNCRGPSVSMSPTSDSKRFTMEWSDHSFDDTLKGLSRPSRGSATGRSSVGGRSSLGGRLSLGKNPAVEGNSETFHSGDELLPQEDTLFDEHPQEVAATRVSAVRPRPSATRLSVELPPTRAPKRQREYKEKLLGDSFDEVEKQAPKESKRQRREGENEEDTGVSHAKPDFVKPARGSRSHSASVPASGLQTIDLRAETAVKPAEAQKPAPVDRHSKARGKSRSVSGAVQKRPPGSLPPVPVVASEPQEQTFGAPQSREMAPPVATLTHSRPISNTVAVHSAPAAPLSDPQAGVPSAQRRGAFLALPQEPVQRQAFLEEFLSGPWVRNYAFAYGADEQTMMYYCLQPGRYGAVYEVGNALATLVLDVNSHLVLHVPRISDAPRREAHPHVSTLYDDEVRVLSMTEAQRIVGRVLNGVLAFVNEGARLRSEGLPPVAVPASYVHQPSSASVPANTKFAYVRRVYPDPDAMFVMFRLSNMRSHVVCNTCQLDIRWQSDRRNNVSLKYYVHGDGTTTPFTSDDTGTMSRIEHILSTHFRV